MNNAESLPSIIETSAAVQSSTSSEFIGGNGPVLPMSEESQAAARAVLAGLQETEVASTPRKRRVRSLPVSKTVLKTLPASIVPDEISEKLIDASLCIQEDGLGDDTGDGDEEYDEVDFEKLGIDPSRPTKAKPGSEEKVLMLAARRAAGMPLWHNDDVTDHGPQTKRAELAAIASANLQNTNAKKK